MSALLALAELLARSRHSPAPRCSGTGVGSAPSALDSLPSRPSSGLSPAYDNLNKLWQRAGLGERRFDSILVNFLVFWVSFCGVGLRGLPQFKALTPSARA